MSQIWFFVGVLALCCVIVFTLILALLVKMGDWVNEWVVDYFLPVFTFIFSIIYSIFSVGVLVWIFINWGSVFFWFLLVPWFVVVMGVLFFVRYIFDVVENYFRDRGW